MNEGLPGEEGHREEKEQHLPRLGSKGRTAYLGNGILALQNDVTGSWAGHRTSRRLRRTAGSGSVGRGGSEPQWGTVELSGRQLAELEGRKEDCVRAPEASAATVGL